MAGDYGYSNARIRAMKAALLDRRDYEALLAAASVEALIEALARTAYKEDIEAALVKVAGVPCVVEGLRRNVVHTVGAVPRFFDGRPRELVRLLVSRWDLSNLIAILRGQARGVPAEEILQALVPAGELHEADLRELVKQPTIRATAELMLTWRLPYAGALAGALRLGNGDLAGVETALHKVRFGDALASLGREANDLLVREMLETEIDVENISLLLRLAGLGDRRAALQARYGAAGPGALLVDGGSLPAHLLGQLGAAADAEAMVRLLQGTSYGAALQNRLGHYRQSGDAGVLERGLEEILVLKGIRMFHRDPLTIAIAIGYLWAKSNEIANVRLIAQGKTLGWGSDMIREEMIWWTRE
ncbi:MAG: V-type ATPase subunit [Deltaproteobacteria bacterium]|nr:V-type ATPase subunit [Deltaproteobacteria bacterium]